MIGSLTDQVYYKEIKRHLGAGFATANSLLLQECTKSLNVGVQTNDNNMLITLPEYVGRYEHPEEEN